MRNATGMPRWTVRASPARSAKRDRRGHRRADPAEVSTERDLEAVEERGADVAGQEPLVPQDRDQQVAVGDQAVDPGPRQDAGQLAGRLLAGRRVRDRPWRASRRSASTPRCRTRSRRRRGCRPRPGSRTSSARRSAAGSRRPGPRRTAAPRSRGPPVVEVRAREPRDRPSATAICSSTRSTPKHRLGDRVLDLEPGVHLQEPEPLGRRVVEELDRAGAAVVDRLGGRARRVVQRGADLVGQSWCGRLLDHLLVPALHRAVPLAEDARRLPSPTTCTSTCRPRSTYGSTKTVPSPNADAASASAAAISPGRSASERTIRMPRPPPPADAFTSSGRSASVGSAGRLEDRHAGRPHQLLGADLRAHRVDRLRRRADPGQSRRLDGPGEVGVLGQEPVAGVDRVGAGRLRGGQHGVDVEVGLGRACCRAAGRRRRPRARTAARRPRRSGPRRSRCRACGRCGRPGTRSRPGWRPSESADGHWRGTPRTGRCRRTACSRSPTGRCPGSCGCRAGR